MMAVVPAQPAPTPPEGGYDDEIFLSPPPDDLQCIICHLTVREPHLITCCGATICEYCMLRSDAKRECPQCRTKDHQVILDRKTRRQTMSLKVQCTSCDWRGELIDYSKHVTERCVSRVVQCGYGCGLYYKASDVAIHQEEECTKRPYDVIVGYYQRKIQCQDLEIQRLAESYRQRVRAMEEERDASYRDHIEQVQTLKQKHSQQVERLEVQLKERDTHLENNQTTFNAELTKLTERLKFKDDGEAEDSTELSSSSSAIAESTSMNRALTEQIMSKDAAFIALMREKEQLREELKLKDGAFIELTREHEQHKDELTLHGYPTDLVPVWCHPELSSLQYAVMPVYRTIQHFSQHKANDKTLYTDPFYTSKGGYKVTLRVVPNGQGSSKGTHVSVAMCLMKGANDNNLQFPMTGIFTVQVMNWMGDVQHFERSIAFDDNKPVECRERVVTGERADGFGFSKFISHNELTSSNKQYLHEDKMCFKINFYSLPQTGDSTVPHWWDGIYVNSITPPCIRTLDNFSVYKRTNAIWQSQPFYTSVDGYKLLLNVDANGIGSGAGTHLSLYARLMKGDNDDKLSFPLNATITVQILNILSDFNHREETIDHYKASLEYRTRITEGDTAPGGWGNTQFISHTELLDNTNNSIKFIDNDKLYFRIVSVDIID